MRVIGGSIKMEWNSIARFVNKQLNGQPEHARVNDELVEQDHLPAFDQNAIAGEWLLSAREDDQGILAFRSDDADLIYTSFDASQPVEQPNDLRGREAQVAQLMSGVLFRRNHGIISGPRGSGKTSLVRTFGQYTDRDGVVVLYSACDDGTHFGDLMREYLEQIPVSSFDPEVAESIGERIRALPGDATPNQVTGLLAQVKYSQIIVITDEFDRISDADLRWKIASLLKLLSDARIPVRFVLVGDASAFDNVVRSHPSLTRHITRVTTDPLNLDAIVEILRDCASRCGLSFSTEALDLIEEVACGSPYHARLFGMHAALCALQGGERKIGVQEARSGLQAAFAEWATLNSAAGAALQSIADGEQGEIEPYVRFARHSAGVMDGTSSDGAHSLTDRQLSALLPAIDPSADLPVFRDATAPQFLIGLCRSTRPDRKPAKEVVQNA